MQWCGIDHNFPTSRIVLRWAGRTRTHFELVLAGDGELRPQIEALLVQHHLKRQVRLTGWLDGEEVRREILAARALVLPTFAEGLPVVITEPMALRRPIIATYVAGIRSLSFRVTMAGWCPQAM